MTTASKPSISTASQHSGATQPRPRRTRPEVRPAGAATVEMGEGEDMGVLFQAKS